ncbi:MAG: TIGR01459 family HAD-type hydrolase [Pseudomonadota bacterium]
MTDAILHGLSAVAEHYDAVLCDVWGVVHNGVGAHHGAGEALANFRGDGKTVLLMTNAPRPGDAVVEQLDRLGVRRDAYDGIVSSGDVVRAHLLDRGISSAYLIGPARDLPLLEGTRIRRTEAPHEADVIVVTDLRGEEETPDDYRDELAELVALAKPFICANPDVVVERGQQLFYCGGALAQAYEEAGGKAEQFGKPHAPIYDHARQRLGRHEAGPKVLAIGDGLPTDITGANRHGLDVLFVTDGIHMHELGVPGRPDLEKVAARLSAEGLSATHVMPKLAW